MGRRVDRQYILSSMNQYYVDREKNCNFCYKISCNYRKRVEQLEYQLYIKKFNGANSYVRTWEVSYVGQRKRPIIKPIL